MTLPYATRSDTSERPIDWLIDILRGNRAEVAITRGTAPDNHIELERYTVFPGENDPKLLVSAKSSRVRSAALRRVGSESSATMKLIRRVGSELAKVRLDQLATPPDVVLSVEAGHVSTSPGDRDPATLVEYLEAALSTLGVHIAVTIGPVRPNRKPVVQVMDADGHLIAYAKIGWDQSTSAMVENESRSLADLATHHFRDVVVPEVLHFGHWQGLTILATAPLDHRDVGVPNEHMIRIALAEITSHASTETSSLAQCEWLTDLTNRALAASAQDLVETIEGLVALHGPTELEFGQSHGDWAPWNMVRLGRQLGVWDWERAASNAPVGIDVVHHHFQQAFAKVADVEAAIADTTGELAAALGQMGVELDRVDLVESLYLLELALRYAESGLAADRAIAETRDGLVRELTTRLEMTEPKPSTVPPKPEVSSQAPKLFTRRMLGGSGVPAPVRDMAKSSLRAWGRATSDRRVLPNTFIIGGQRCGTTSLFRYLSQHPCVTGPLLEKGVHYFDTNYGEDVDWYQSHFPTQRSARLSLQRNGCELRVMEACPYYSFHPVVPERIAAVTEDAKFIMLVRDPADRALSHHNHEVKRGFESESFERALELEQTRLSGEAERLNSEPAYVSFEHQHHGYVARGRYEEQVARYDEQFGAENVLVLGTTDLEREPAKTVGAVLKFLGVALEASISFPRFNARAYEPMNEDVQRWLRDEFAVTSAAIGERLERDDPWG